MVVEVKVVEEVVVLVVKVVVVVVKVVVIQGWYCLIDVLSVIP